MLLQIEDKPRGVRCDLTGKEYLDTFVYYSLEGKMVTVDTNKKIISRDNNISLDLDICEDAYNEIYELVKKNVGPVKAGTIKCDLTNQHLVGKFEYWAITITHVKVDVTTEPPMQVVSSIFDLNVSSEEVMKWAVKAKENRNKPFTPPAVKKPVLKLGAVPKEDNPK